MLLETSPERRREKLAAKPSSRRAKTTRLPPSRTCGGGGGGGGQKPDGVQKIRAHIRLIAVAAAAAAAAIGERLQQQIIPWRGGDGREREMKIEEGARATR